MAGTLRGAASTATETTAVAVRLVDPIDVVHSAAGARFPATLDEPVIAGDRVIVRKGAPAVVQLVHSHSEAELILLSIGDPPLEIHSAPVLAKQIRKAQGTGSHLGRDALAGALGGGLIMGRIGIPVGAAGGLLAGETIHAIRKQLGIPAETRIPFVLIQSIDAQ